MPMGAEGAKTETGNLRSERTEGLRTENRGGRTTGRRTNSDRSRIASCGYELGLNHLHRRNTENEPRKTIRRCGGPTERGKRKTRKSVRTGGART